MPDDITPTVFDPSELEQTPLPDLSGYDDAVAGSVATPVPRPETSDLTGFQGFQDAPIQVAQLPDAINTNIETVTVTATHLPSDGANSYTKSDVENLVNSAYSLAAYYQTAYGPGSNPATITERQTVQDSQAYAATQHDLAHMEGAVSEEQLTQWGLPSTYLFGASYYLYQNAYSAGYANTVPPRSVLSGMLPANNDVPEVPRYMNGVSPDLSP